MQFSRSRRWDEMDASVRRIYHGQLGCSDNLHFRHGGCGTAAQLVDAYQPLQPPLAAAWRSMMPPSPAARCWLRSASPPPTARGSSPG